jgi:hypothetical protein
MYLPFGQTDTRNHLIYYNIALRFAMMSGSQLVAVTTLKSNTMKYDSNIYFLTTNKQELKI